MGHTEISQIVRRRDKALTGWSVGVTGLAAAMIVAGAVVAFSSGQADARPQYVTKSKPCGSCHPPNKPPTKK